jgi:hypothetical protein
MGKTPMQLEWARHVPGNVLILAPLAVAAQTVREGRSSASASRYAREAGDGKARHHDCELRNAGALRPGALRRRRAGRVEHPQSLRRQDAHRDHRGVRQTPFRLACTATPAPNDYMELGNHAEFLGVMSRVEMLAMFFVHDGGETQKWRLKGHAEASSGSGSCSWAVMHPQALGPWLRRWRLHLPELVMHEVTVKVDKPTDGYLFPVEARRCRSG